MFFMVKAPTIYLFFIECSSILPDCSILVLIALIVSHTLLYRTQSKWHWFMMNLRQREQGNMGHVYNQQVQAQALDEGGPNYFILPEGGSCGEGAQGFRKDYRLCC